MSEGTRAALKAAAKKVFALENQIETLEAAAERAESASAEASTELENYAELEKEITRWRVNQLKKGGGTKVLPDDLKARINAKRTAADELEQSQSTSEAIAEELKDVRARLRIVARDRTKCAIAVLHEMGDLLADELRTINTRRAELIQILQGLSEVKVPLSVSGHPVAIGVSAATYEAINMGNAFAFPPNAPDPVDEVTKRWTCRLDAICADPDAVIAAPKHLLPSHYVPGSLGKFQGSGLPFSAGTPGNWVPEQI